MAPNRGNPGTRVGRRRALTLVGALAGALALGPGGIEAAPPTHPGRPAAGLRSLGAPVRVAALIDAETLALADGRTLRLAGLLPGAGGDPAALAAFVGAALGLWVEDPDAPFDQHERLLAHATTPEGVWVQAALVGVGQGVVCPRPDRRAGLRALLAIEAAARDEGAGLWRPGGAWRVRRADEAAPDAAGFALLAGVPRAVEARRERTYVNFGADYRTDATLSVPRAALRGLAGAGLAPETLVGRPIRARGWLESRNGPLIEITLPEQLELLATGPG